ncbi:MAG: DUF5615 family PIN-like protein [Chloroflexota bacterium]|nr:DUF5615 family PIN-like protein [Chloroflexota bacterium]
MKLLLDEHFSPRLAATLRSMGHDAVAVVERPDLIGRPDRVVWRAASQELRVMVTQDLADFGPLATTTVGSGHHPGLVLVAARTFAPTRGGIGRLASALDALASEAGTSGLDDRLVWLRPVD